MTEPLRYIAVEREPLRSLLFEEAALSDLVLPAFIARRDALQAVPGILAAGDVRSGSTKRCATAVGEGTWAVRLVHAHLA